MTIDVFWTKWIDYRDKLGVGFNDNRKFEMLSAMSKNYIENVIEENYDENSHLNYCQMVEEDYHDYYCPHQHLKESLDKCKSTKELVDKYITLDNTYSADFGGFSYNVEWKCLKSISCAA